MKQYTALGFFLNLLLLGVVSLVFIGCGQQIPPTGGPKDSLPPKLVAAIPQYGTKNFKADKITLIFDEYITLEKPFEKLIYSPTPKTNPQANGKLKTVTIKLKDTLEENTTYSIDFGNAVRDINENNPIQNFYYTFSTGPYIDSGFLSGQVLLAETGKTDSTMIVVLHNKMEDSTVAKERPRYYARIDKDGNFIFRNLQPGRYNVFGLKDVDGGKKYDQTSEFIAFLDSSIEIGIDTSVILYAFQGYSEKLNEIKTPKAKVSGDAKKTDAKRFKFSNNLDGGKQDLLGPLVLSSEHPLKEIDSTKIKLTDEDFKPISGYRIEQDSTRKKLTINYVWPENNLFKLIIEKDFATDTLDNKYTQTDTLSFTSKRESEYGSIDIKIDSVDTFKHPILLFTKDNKIVFKQKIEQPRYKIRLFNPGGYQLSVLYDTNNNGVWDTGDYWQKRQPEIVISRKQPLVIKANWDNELLIVYKDFAPGSP